MAQGNAHSLSFGKKKIAKQYAQCGFDYIKKQKWENKKDRKDR